MFSESNNNSLGPNVRIGVLQHVPRIRFNANAPLDILGAGGKKLGELKPGTVYQASMKNSHGVSPVYRVRLGVFDTNQQAQDYLENQEGLPGPLHVKSAGRKTKLGEEVISDNREYWATIGAFDDNQDAGSLSMSLLARFPQNTVVSDFKAVPEGIVRIINPDSGEEVCHSERKVRIEPREAEQTRIAIHDIVVGIDFHWEHKETQAYRGAVEFVIDNKGMLTAVNELSIEEYLYSVNSSEMLSTCPEELLKAQTICARNTVLATVARHHVNDPFDICADDHCQCYRGATREAPVSLKAANVTRGELMIYEGKVCDARYAKICGGIMEPADTVWWEGHIPYLSKGKDAPPELAEKLEYANTEEKAKAWIDNKEVDVFCNTLTEDLPEELHYARKYFRWEVEYTREDIERLLDKRVNVHVGQVTDLVPVERGPSGRIVWLDIVGTKGTERIGKELRIRKALSDTHLYSSAFYVIKEMGEGGLPEKFILKGAGWGHGAGLCQIGAAIMAHRGYDYKEILAHYYAGMKLESRYGETTSEVPTQEQLLAPYAGMKDMLCWEVLNCYDARNCPVVEKNLGDRCWEVLGTRCFGQVQDTEEKKRKTCASCAFYKMKHEQ